MLEQWAKIDIEYLRYLVKWISKRLGKVVVVSRWGAISNKHKSRRKNKGNERIQLLR